VNRLWVRLAVSFAVVIAVTVATVALLAGFMRGFVGVGSGMMMAPVFAILFGPLQTVNRPALPAGGAGIAALRGRLRDSALSPEGSLAHE